MIFSASFSGKLKSFFGGSLLNKTYIIDSILRKNITSAITGFAKGTVLDLGCGEMPYRGLFGKTARKYISLEYPGATNYFGETIAKVDVYGDAQKIPFRGNSFDTVFSSEVLEHVAEPLALLQESFRVLQEDGVFIFTVPYSYKIHMEPHDYFRFTRYGLRFLLNEAGFEILELKSNGGNLAAIGQSLSNYLYEAFILDQETGQPKNLLRLVLVLPWCALFQGIFFIFDKLSKVESLPLGYLVVARKPGPDK